MEKLIELANASVKVTVFGPGTLYDTKWHVHLEKKDDGVELKVQSVDNDPLIAAEDAYERWVKTTRGIPTHNLNQITYEPPKPADLDDEIPF